MMRDRSFTELSDKMKIRKIVTFIIKAVVIILFVITLNKVFMPKYINENKDGRITEEYYRTSKYSDVIFAGSSTVFSAVNPAILWDEQGISSYVRANASQTMWISYYMIEDAIHTRKPDMVCLDVTFIKYDDDFVEEPSTRKAVDGMRWSSSKYDCIRASMGEDEKMMEYVVPLFRFHTRWKELKWDDIRYAWYNKPVTLNGYIFDNNTEPADSDVIEYTGSFDSISPKNEEYLRRAIEECLNSNVRIMLFKTPAYSDNWSDELDVLIGNIANEYGISYRNFDKDVVDIGLDPATDTPDKGAHLNSKGAVKFSAYIADLLRKDYDIPDRRDDKGYVNYWNKTINARSGETGE